MWRKLAPPSFAIRNTLSVHVECVQQTYRWVTMMPDTILRRVNFQTHINFKAKLNEEIMTYGLL